MEDMEIEIMFGMILKTFFFGVYADCLLMLEELTKKVNCKKGLKELKKVTPAMYYLGNDIFSLLKHKYIIVNTNTGIEKIKRIDMISQLIDTKRYMIRAMLYLLEDHPISTPQILDQVNKLRGSDQNQ